MNEDKSDIHNGIAWAIIFALAAIIMSIVAVAHKCPRYDLDFDYIGLIVGILSFLVTALLGWQVFNAIENVKTLKKMDGLETELRSKSEQIVTLNSQVLDIIEAHHERSLAQGIKYWEYKYEHACKSLKLFIRGNIKSDYEPLLSLLRDMASILERMSKEATEDEKIVFARAFAQFDNEYNEAIGILHRREGDLRAMRNQLTSLRDRRKKLFDDYAKMETSEEKAEREKRQASESNGNPN